MARLARRLGAALFFIFISQILFPHWIGRAAIAAAGVYSTHLLHGWCRQRLDVTNFRLPARSLSSALTSYTQIPSPMRAALEDPPVGLARPPNHLVLYFNIALPLSS